MDIDFDARADRHRQRRPGVPARHLADAEGGRGRDPAQREARDVQEAVRRRVRRRRRTGRRSTSRAARRYAWERRLDVREEPAVLRGHDDDAAGHAADRRARGCSRMFGDSITTDHISPAGNIPAASPAGKWLIAHGVQTQGLQLVRRAARQSRSDDARHVREHPPAQRAGAGHGRLVDGDDAGRRAGVHLRRGDGVPAAGHAARRSSPARSTAPARRATGRPRARCCSACAR